jgi:tetratricopeptide (TPR) repeat protein
LRGPNPLLIHQETAHMLLGPRLKTLITILLFGTVCQAAFAAAFQAEEKTESTPAAATKPDPRIGTKVIVTVAGAALKTPEATVWKAYLGEIFTVSLTSGEWLWINDKRGWLWEKETVPFTTAIQEMSTKLRTEPTPENYHLRGIAYVAHRDYDKAIADFTQSLKLKKENAGVLNNRGQAYYLMGDYAHAVSDLNVAITLDTKHFVAMNNRALCYIAAGELDKARADLNAAITLHNEYPEALNNRGVVASRKGDYKAAVADLTAAIKIYDNYTDAYGNRSFAYRKLDMFKEAVADVKLAMKIDPNDYKPVNDHAWILATAEDATVLDPNAAVKEAVRACEMTQYSNWNTLDTLATAYAAQRDFKSALQWITTALEKAPEKYKPMLEKHRQLIAAGKPVPQ